ncbi:hypothetical protein A9G10_11630 [Gilliamella sp. wkB308]|nr:hypothetical protein A9G10_11630 [Gilliamella apicola]
MQIVNSDFVYLDDEFIENLDETFIQQVDMLESAALPNKFRSIGLIKNWITAGETRVHLELQHGNPVLGFKMVMGRQG